MASTSLEALVSQAITRCPHCDTSFRVTETQLLIADGSVRCGACMHVFQAEDYIISPLLDVTERIAIESAYWADFEDYVLQVFPRRPNRDENDVSSRQGYRTLSESQDRENIEGSISDDTDVERDSSQAGAHDAEDVMVFFLEYIQVHPGVSPSSESFNLVGVGTPSGNDVELGDGPHLETDSFSETDSYSDTDYEEYKASIGSTAARASGSVEVEQIDDTIFDLDLQEDPGLLIQDKRRLFRARSLRWLPGIGFLCLIGFLQYAYFNLDVYSQQENYRDWYLKACRLVSCDVPVYGNIDELQTSQLVIRTHPDTERALMIDVLLRNSAEFRQNFPGLRLRFFDLNGELVAGRIFRVSEYLGGELRGLKYIPAETEVRLSLEILDPGENALGYQMDVVNL
jgi:predicted Zn finger-like uncharacterized protein